MIPGSVVAAALISVLVLSLTCGFVLGYLTREQADEL